VSDSGQKKVSTARVLIWIIVAGIGAYLLISGVLGILAKG
jgi:hypothetical protein